MRNENLHLKSEFAGFQKQLSASEAEQNRLRTELSATRDELAAGKQVHQVFSSDLAMHRLMKETLAGEVKVLQADLQRSKGALEDMQVRWEKKEGECAGLRKELGSQATQATVAQTELERVTHELGLLKASRDLMTKQWEAALAAMHRRDETMTAVSAQKSSAESEVLVRRNEQRAIGQDLDSLRAQHADQTAQLLETSRRLQDLLHEHEGLKKAHANLQRDSAAQAQDRIAQDASTLSTSKQNALLTAENQRLVARCSQLRDESTLLKTQLQTAVELNRSIDRSIASVENSSVARVEASNKELELRAVALDRARQLEANKATELVVQLQELARANAMLNDEYVATCSKYDAISSQLRSLSASFEHMTYRATKAEGEAAALRTTKEEERIREQLALQGNITRLQGDLSHRTEEVAKMNRAFVVAEDQVLQAQKQHAEISQATDKLKSELKKAQGVKDRLKATIDTLTEEKSDILRENNEHRLTMRKLQEQLATLADQNVALQSKLADAGFAERQRRDTHSGELASAKAELARMRDKKGATTGALEFSEREKGHWERKHEFVAIKLAAQTLEMEKLQGLYFAQQKQLQSLHKEQSTQEKQYAGWMKSFEQMFEKQAAKKAASSSSTAAAAAGPKQPLTFSASQNLSAKQVLHNFNQVAASLPANSASFATSSSPPSSAPTGGSSSARRVGANIVSGVTHSGGGGGNASSGAAPALDSLNDMMAHMARNGVQLQAHPGGSMAGGSATARTLSDSDSRSSLLARDGSGAPSSTFLEGLVHELRGALHKSSVAAAERGNELVKVREQLRALLVEQNQAASKEHELLSRVHLLSTQQQSLATNLAMSHRAYARAEQLCASFERQLRDAQRELMAAAVAPAPSLSASLSSDLEHKDASSYPTPQRTAGAGGASSLVRTIDYQLYADLEPSPLLRSILDAPSSHGAGGQSPHTSMQSLSSYAAAATSTPAGGMATGTIAAGEDRSLSLSRSLQQHGRSARVRPNRSPTASSSGGSSGGSGGGGSTFTLSIAHPGQLVGAKSDAGFSSSGSLHSAGSALPGGHSGIASTVSMLSSISASSPSSKAHLVAPPTALRTASSSAAVLPAPRGHSATPQQLTASAATLGAPNPPSTQSSFANLPITVKPNGRQERT